jgi:hypothetical protein
MQMAELMPRYNAEPSAAGNWENNLVAIQQQGREIMQRQLEYQLAHPELQEEVEDVDDRGERWARIHEHLNQNKFTRDERVENYFVPQEAVVNRPFYHNPEEGEPFNMQLHRCAGPEELSYVIEEGARHLGDHQFYDSPNHLPSDIPTMDQLRQYPQLMELASLAKQDYLHLDSPAMSPGWQEDVGSGSGGEYHHH